jgi:hypothetical protein
VEQARKWDETERRKDEKTLAAVGAAVESMEEAGTIRSNTLRLRATGPCRPPGRDPTRGGTKGGDKKCGCVCGDGGGVPSIRERLRYRRRTFP